MEKGGEILPLTILSVVVLFSRSVFPRWLARRTYVSRIPSNINQDGANRSDSVVVIVIGECEFLSDATDPSSVDFLKSIRALE